MYTLDLQCHGDVLCTQNEIMAILQLGVPPDKIIYAQPCKQISYLRYAASSGVSMMTFDNEAEVYKIKEHFQSARYTKDVNYIPLL